MLTSQYDNLKRVVQREERERILGIIEYYRDFLGDSSYEQYAKKTLNKVIEAIEHNKPPK